MNDENFGQYSITKESEIARQQAKRSERENNSLAHETCYFRPTGGTKICSFNENGVSLPPKEAQ